MIEKCEVCGERFRKGDLRVEVVFQRVIGIFPDGYSARRLGEVAVHLKCLAKLNLSSLVLKWKLEGKGDVWSL